MGLCKASICRGKTHPLPHACQVTYLQVAVLDDTARPHRHCSLQQAVRDGATLIQELRFLRQKERLEVIGSQAPQMHTLPSYLWVFCVSKGMLGKCRK